MSCANLLLRSTCLSLMMLLGSMVAMTAGSMATTWDYKNGLEIKTTETVSGNLVAGTTMLFLVPAQSVVIHCTGFTVTEGTLLLNNTAHAKLQFTGCSTKIKGKDSRECQPEILPIAAKIKPLLHNSKVYLLAESLTAGANLTVIHYNEELCTQLPVLPAISGSIVFECYTGALVEADCKTPRVKQLIRPASAQALFGDTLRYGLNEAFLHGEAEVFLTTFGLVGSNWNALI